MNEKTENQIFFNFRHEKSPFVLPAYVNGRKTKKAMLEGTSKELSLLDLSNLEFLKLEAFFNNTKEEVTSKAIKEVIAFTSFNTSLNSFLEASLEEAILKALEDNSFIYFKEAKPLEASNTYLASNLLVNNLEVKEALNTLGTSKHLEFIEEALKEDKTSLYCFNVPKNYLKALNCGYLAFKNDLNLKTKPSKVTFINNRFNKNKALALTSLVFDNIHNVFTISKEDLEAFLKIVPLEASNNDIEKAKPKKYTNKFLAIASKLEAKTSSKALSNKIASSSLDNKTIKEALTTKEAIIYYKELKRRSLFNDKEKAFIKAKASKKASIFSYNYIALKEALEEEDYLEASSILNNTSFYNIKEAIELLEEEKEALEDKEEALAKTIASLKASLEALEEEEKEALASFNDIEEAYLEASSNIPLKEVIAKEEVLEEVLEAKASLEEALKEASNKALEEVNSLLEEAYYLEEVLEEEDNSFSSFTTNTLDYLEKEEVTSFKYKEAFKEVKEEEALEVIKSSLEASKKALYKNIAKKYFIEAKKDLEALTINIAYKEAKNNLDYLTFKGKLNYNLLIEAKTKSKAFLKEAKDKEASKEAKKEALNRYSYFKALAIKLNKKHLALLEAYNKEEEVLEALASKITSSKSSSKEDKASKEAKASKGTSKGTSKNTSKEEKASKVFKLTFKALEKALEDYSFIHSFINTNISFKEVLDIKYKVLAKK